MPVIEGYCSHLFHNADDSYSVCLTVTDETQFNGAVNKVTQEDDTSTAFKRVVKGDKSFLNVWMTVPYSNVEEFNTTYQKKKITVIAYPTRTDFIAADGKRVKCTKLDADMFLATRKRFNAVLIEAAKRVDYQNAVAVCTQRIAQNTPDTKRAVPTADQ